MKIWRYFCSPELDPAQWYYIRAGDQETADCYAVILGLDIRTRAYEFNGAPEHFINITLHTGEPS